MEVSVGYSDPISTVRDVKKTVKVILAEAQISGKITVVNPDIGRLIDTNSIAVGSINFGDLEVSENNVLLATNVESNTGECCNELVQALIYLIMEYSQLPAAPMMVLSDEGRMVSLPVNLPLTIMVRGPERLAAS